MTNTDDNKGPLDGLNVIDFGWYYAGAMTGMLLADQGANVVRIVKPGDKELPDQQYRLLNRNKKLLTLDLKTEEGKEQALSLIERADVLIENFRPGVMKRLGLDYASVKEGNPGLIYLSLPGFASTDKERAHIQAWEGIVSAASGVYTEVHMSRQLLAFPPVYISSPLCSAYGAMHGVISILAALNARGRLGAGTVIEAPLVDAGLSAFSVNFIVQRGLVIPQLRSSGRDVLEPPELLKPFIFSPQENLQSQITKLESAQDVCMSTLFQFYPCKDNRSIMLWSGVPEHAKGVLKAMGIYEALLERGVVFGDQWEPGINNFANGLGPEHTEWLRQKITETFLTKTAAEWESELAELGPVVMPRTREEWLALAPLRASGVFTEFGDEGDRLIAPGPIVDINEGSADNTTEFFDPTAVTVEEAHSYFQVDELSGTPTDIENFCKGDLLNDINVLDLSNVLAGPTAGYTLAQFGANVIKADPPNYPYIGLGNFNLDVTQGKRSILTDLTTAPGREVLRRLIEWADIVVHNCLDDISTRLGISYEQLKQINPQIICTQLAAFGGPRRGGWENRPGFDPVAGAASGLMVDFSSLEKPQYCGSTAFGDTMTGLAAAFAALMGLYRRHRRGLGSEARTSLARANNYIQLPLMIAKAGECDSTEPTGQLSLGIDWAQRMYQCSDGWIFVAAVGEASKRFVEILGADDTVSEAALETTMKERPCADWCRDFERAEISCYPVVTIGDICADNMRNVENEAADDHAQGPLEVLRWDKHPCGSPVTIPAPSWVRVGEAQSYKRLTPGPRLGAHTKEILLELGYSEEEAKDLIRLGVSHEYMPAIGNRDDYFWAATNRDQS